MMNDYSGYGMGRLLSFFLFFGGLDSWVTPKRNGRIIHFIISKLLMFNHNHEYNIPDLATCIVDT